MEHAQSRVRGKVQKLKYLIMSAEPGRTTAYSKDLRWRVIWQRLGMGLGYREIAHRLNISVGTAYNTFKLFEHTGSVEAKKARKRPELCKLDYHHQLYVIGLVLDNPKLYLHEVCHHVKEITNTEVSPATICSLLASYGITRKKIQHVALQRRVEYRGLYIANISFFPKEVLVWVDETGCDNREMLRKFGYSIRGERAISQKLLVRGRRISAIAALSWTSGIIDVDLTTESVNGDAFYDFVCSTLIPNMYPYDGTSPNSVVVMDNCSIHHVAEVQQLLDDAGIPVIYLPPYSPDMNPIETAFSHVKSYLKLHDDVLEAFPNKTTLVKAAFQNIKIEHCQAWIKHTKFYC